MKRDLVLGRSFAVLVASVLLSMLARKFVKSNKKSMHREADDTDASSSSAASAVSNSYDVFLSFSGEDTRRTFTDHLYKDLVEAGICVFRDNMLPEGEKIGINLFQAIKNSKISIAILSPKYASSEWCLEELVEMTERIKSGHIILPIFYHVEPSHVKKQKGSFGKTFSRLSSNYVKEDVAKWKQALREVAAIKGWEPKKTAGGHEGDLVKMVVRKVLNELKKAFRLDVTEHLVGIDNAVERVLRLLDDNPSATQIVGIYGMGGISKTTLAKVVHNKLSDQFQHCSFIANIRESSRCNGIFYLQNQLIRDLKENDQVANNDEGISLLGSRFKLKKVLILLDDVDDNEQIRALIGKYDWFEMGSRIIITTRSKSVLDDAGVKCKYKLEEIPSDESLTLFSRHAFRRDFPPCEFESLTRDVVATTGGLPLALEVIGSFLCGKRQAIWQDAVKKLQKVPHKKVREKLMISYDALDNEEKQIFLDIACFLIGEDLRCASYMWDACNFSPTMVIETLSFMSLIKIGDDGKVQMHDQLRDLGRDIVRKEDYDLPMNRSRLWLHEEALEVLERNEEIKKNRVQALCLDNLDKDLTKRRSFAFRSQLKNEFTTKQFETLPNLRFLSVCDAKLIGDSRSLLRKLLWLVWRGCPAFVPTNFCLEKLVILDLSRSDISELWECWSHLKMAKQLKVLNLKDCNHLEVTPDLSAFQNLKIFQLSRCENLKQIHPSIGAAKGLVFFYLEKCHKLRELPQELGKLGNLEELDASGCFNLRGEIHIDRLSLLRILRLDFTKFSGFHGTFDKLSRLEILDLFLCRELQSLPKLPASLTVLRVAHRHRTFPQLSHLIHLKGLVISCRLLESMPELPSALLELSLDNCHQLKELRSLSSLEFLSNLELKFCEDLTEIRGLERLKSLVKLVVRGCNKLSNLDGLEHLESLRCLYLTLDGPILKDDQVSGFEKFKNLKKLRVQCCESLVRVDVSQLTHLKELDFVGCHNLLEIKGLERLKNLSSLSLAGCPSIGRLPDFSCFHNLQKVFVDEHSKIPEVGRVRKARHLGGPTIRYRELRESRRPNSERHSAVQPIGRVRGIWPRCPERVPLP